MGLASPVELLELQDGQSASFVPLSFEVDPGFQITPAHRPAGKTVRAIRVHVGPQDKPAGPHYWDLTASTLVAQIEPHLRAPGASSKRITIRAVGFGAKKRFTLDVQPR